MKKEKAIYIIINVKAIFITISINVTIINEYRFYYINIKNAIIFTSLRIKKYYDVYYQFKYFNVGDLINLRFYKEYQIFIIKFKKVNRLTYRLKLPNNIRIYKVISIIYLKLAIDSANNFYS